MLRKRKEKKKKRERKDKAGKIGSFIRPYTHSSKKDVAMAESTAIFSLSFVISLLFLALSDTWKSREMHNCASRSEEEA